MALNFSDGKCVGVTSALVNVPQKLHLMLKDMFLPGIPRKGMF